VQSREQAAALGGWERSISQEARVLEEKVREAIVIELQRQAAERRDQLKLGEPEGDLLSVEGLIDLEALATAVVGSVAGGP
jgi:hypothetical protein